MCHAEGHNAAPSVRLEPATLQSQVKHSTTETLCSRVSFVMLLLVYDIFIILHNIVSLFSQFIKLLSAWSSPDVLS